MKNQLILSVSQLNRYVRSMLEGNENLTFLYVVGEISNFKAHYASGHLYFSLKDEDGLIRCVMFRSSASRLKWMPENGMRVVCLGRVSLYEKDGQYQLYVEDMQPDGLGALSLAAEQLRRRLAEEGLFDEENKQPLPRYPERIAVVTSETGAAVRDILSVLARRWPSAEVVLCPVLVQGEAAAADIAATLRRLSDLETVDLIIVGRGGGSASDLQAFNEEILVRAVAASPIPIISAVGHETDYTLCDLAADLRAPTPSAAAELAVPEATALRAELLQLRARLASGVQQNLTQKTNQLAQLQHHPSMKTPLYRAEQLSQRLDLLSGRMHTLFDAMLKEKQAQLGLAAGALHALSPLAVLARGYAAVYRQGVLIQSVREVSAGQEMTVRLHDGAVACTVIDTEENTNAEEGFI